MKILLILLLPMTLFGMSIMEDIPSKTIKMEKNQIDLSLEVETARNPYLYKDKPIFDGMINGLWQVNYGLFQDLNLQYAGSYSMVQGVNGNDITMSSFGDSYLSLNYNLYKIIISPMVILPTGNNLFNSTGGYGTSFFIDESFHGLPLYFNIGYYKFIDNKYESDIRSSMTDLTIGHNLKLSSDLNLDIALSNKSIGNISSNTLSTVMSAQFNSFMIKYGMSHNMSDDKKDINLFGQIIFQFNKKKNTRLKKSKAIQFPIEYKNNNLPPRFIKIKGRNPSSIQLFNDRPEVDRSMFYSVINMKKEETKKEEIKEKITEEKIVVSTIKTVNDINYYIKKYTQSQNTIKYFTNLWKKNVISIKKAFIEFQWGVRVIKKRRANLTHKISELSLPTKKALNINPNLLREREPELFALNFLNKNKNILDKKKVTEVTVNATKPIETEKEREIRLTRLQSKAWDIAKTHTLLDLRKIEQEKIRAKVNKSIIKKTTEPVKVEAKIEKVKNLDIYHVDQEIKTIVKPFKMTTLNYNNKNINLNKISIDSERLKIKKLIKDSKKKHDYSSFYKKYKVKKEKIPIIKTKMSLVEPQAKEEVIVHQYKNESKLEELEPDLKSNKTEAMELLNSEEGEAIKIESEYLYEVEESDGPSF